MWWGVNTHADPAPPGTLSCAGSRASMWTWPLTFSSRRGQSWAQGKVRRLWLQKENTAAQCASQPPSCCTQAQIAPRERCLHAGSGNEPQLSAVVEVVLVERSAEGVVEAEFSAGWAHLPLQLLPGAGQVGGCRAAGSFCWNAAVRPNQYRLFSGKQLFQVCPPAGLRLCTQLAGAQPQPAQRHPASRGQQLPPGGWLQCFRRHGGAAGCWWNLLGARLCRKPAVPAAAPGLP